MGCHQYFSNDADVPHPRYIRALAAYYADKVRLVQPEAPYYLMGVSFGGVIAYETAQVLMSQGHQVNFLGLIRYFFYPSRKSAAKILPSKRAYYWSHQEN